MKCDIYYDFECQFKCEIQKEFLKIEFSFYIDTFGPNNLLENENQIRMKHEYESTFYENYNCLRLEAF